MDNASKQNSDQKPQHVKIEFHVPDEDGKTNIETMWAIDLGNNLYQLDNLPFYAYGISWHDKFKAEKQNEQGFAKFKEVTEKSGNKTLRLIFTEEDLDTRTAEQILENITEIGCSFEGATASYYTINVPADIEMTDITEILTSNEIMWEHADPIYDEISD
tara:strand:- start:1666 stop:2145 length:480 start_codon:yes stop_codon:yes gene_type:complete